MKGTYVQNASFTQLSLLGRSALILSSPENPFSILPGRRSSRVKGSLVTAACTRCSIRSGVVYTIEERGTTKGPLMKFVMF